MKICVLGFQGETEKAQNPEAPSMNGFIYKSTYLLQILLIIMFQVNQIINYSIHIKINSTLSCLLITQNQIYTLNCLQIKQYNNIYLIQIQKKMKGHKSVMSLSLMEQKKSLDKMNRKEIQNYDSNSTWLQLHYGMQQIRKQLKQKVNRSEFVSGLCTKLSISQLASINFAGLKTKGKQNKSNNIDYNHLQLYQSLKQQINILQQQINNILTTQRSSSSDMLRMQQFSQYKQLELEIHYLKKQISDNKQSLQILQENVKVGSNSEKQSFAELQAYIYKKADRTQIQKLFTLNQLLVIQIEQAKQKVQDYNRLIPKKLSEYEQGIKLYMDKLMEIEGRNTQNLELKIKNQVQNQMNQLKEEVDKIMDLLEMKQGKKQQGQQFYRATIHNLNQKINSILEEQNLFMKQLSARVNVLQLKQNQINRAAREVDTMKNQFSSMKLDIQQLYEKSNLFNSSMRQFCQIRIAQCRDQIEQKMNTDLQNTCQEIMRKIIVLSNQMVDHEHLDEVINSLKQKNKQMNLFQIENEKKISYLDARQKQMLQNIQQEQQQNEQRLNLIKLQLKNYLNLKQFEQKIDKFISLEQLKQIGKQIDQKMLVQIGKIVEEQNKINQVVCSENILAKWFWTQGQLKGGNLIGWDKQIINTLPQNFKWNRNQPLIIIAKSGYYRIQMGFYSKKKPTVQLIVNGQTIISAVNSSSYVIHHSSGKLRDVSNSQISGLTYIDFLLLPDNAKIAISYIGQYTGQGFFSIQRL